MRETFYETLDKWGPKHWSFGVRKNSELLAWITAQTIDLPAETPFAQRVYCAVTGERAPCPRGNPRKLKSILDGWMFCGTTAQCACAKEQVAHKVSAAKQALTTSERDVIQSKREVTNLERYGHVNTGQTVAARTAHKAFYADLDNVRNQLRKQVATMMELYGVENAGQSRQIIEQRQATLLERYGVKNPMQIKSVAARSVATRLLNGYSADYYRRNYDQLAARMLEDFGLKLMTAFESYTGTADYPLLDLQCSTCGRMLKWRLSYSGKPRCPVCSIPTVRRSKSSQEIAIFQFIKSKMAISDLISGDRTFISPFEIDILSESHRVAIEHSGLYYHSEGQKPDHMYHLNKLRAVEAVGFRLFTIFGDEWLDHADIVKSKICHLFNRIEDRRYARKLQLVEIDASTANAFYETAHIQGGTHASQHLALCDKGQIIAGMSFAQARPSQGLPENSYDLTRFATAPYTTVVGGASRLFSHFVRTHNPTAIVSYADRRWSDGGLYRTLGFTLERVNPPSYSYVEKYLKRHFRFNFRKEVLESILGETDSTEWDIMQALDYDRIWDCGTYRFVWWR